MISKFKTSTDFQKSLENRLKNLANQTDNDLQRLRRTVAFDRLLARLLAANAPYGLEGEENIPSLLSQHLIEKMVRNLLSTKGLKLSAQFEFPYS